MRIREQVLEMWSQGHCADDICDLADIERDQLFRLLARCRAMGDPRAARRIGRVPAMRRRRKIIELVNDGKSPTAIAKALGVTKRLVLLRIQEMQT